MTAGRLTDDEFDHLTPCAYCNPEPSREMIDEINKTTKKTYTRH